MRTDQNAPSPIRLEGVAPPASRARRWGWPQYLAVVGVAFLIWNGWTLVAWLADGPRQVTEFRDPHSVSWWAAHILEGSLVVASIPVVVLLIRGCRRERRFLTFDVMFCLCCSMILWGDVGINVFQPVYVSSSNFVNLTGPCGHMPFVVNPDCGRVPDAILMFFLLETFMLLAFSKGFARLVARWRSRRPDLTNPQLFLRMIGVAAIASLGEIVAIGLGLWTYTGPRWMSISPGSGGNYHFIILIETSVFFAAVAAIYVFRNDRGETIVERGLDGYPPRRRRAITCLALYAAVQLLLWGPGSTPMAIASFFQDGWRKMPAHLLNDVCDAPGVTGTRYGPCPGSPGYQMPGRHSLPGESP